MDNPPLISEAQPDGWWQRNYKWFLPTVIGGVFLLIIGFTFAFVAVLSGFMKSSDACSVAMARVRAAPTVIAILGTPIEEGFFVSGSIHVDGPSGRADLAIPVKGPKAGARIYVTATKTLGAWHFKELIVEIDGTRQRIDLSDKDVPPDDTEPDQPPDPPTNQL